MSHNYFEDYKNTFAQYSASQVPTLELSDVALSGMTYCAAVLKISSKVRASLGSLRDNDVYWTNVNAVPHLVHKLRATLMRQRWSEAIAITNFATWYDVSEIMKNLREEFGDAFFGADLVEEVNKAIDIGERGAPVMDALCEVFPVLTKQKFLYSIVNNEIKRAASMMTVERIDRIMASPGLKEVEVVEAQVLMSNPFLTSIVRMMIADAAMTHPSAGIGQVHSGRPRVDAEYTKDTLLQVYANSGQLQKYVVYRRLSRAGLYYVAYLDVYLTALTDMCRIVEQILPADSKVLVDGLANAYMSSRTITLSE